MSEYLLADRFGQKLFRYASNRKNRSIFKYTLKIDE